MKQGDQRMFVGVQNDAIFILDAEPRPSTCDVFIEGQGEPNVVAKMANNDPGAEALARVMSASLVMAEALKQAQRALAMLVEPEAIRSTTRINAWAACVAAEQKVRAALLLSGEKA